jgi:ribosomal-protein-alanine N-acetyltransferase
MSIKISLARDADCASIAEMSRRFIEAGLPWSWTQSRVRYYVRNADSAVIVAREGRRIVGFAIMEFHDSHGHLNLLAVLPGWRQRGVGRSLVEWLQDSARVAGVFLVRLELRATNKAARTFYSRLGYIETGVSPLYYAGQEDAIRMTSDLTVLAPAHYRSE